MTADDMKKWFQIPAEALEIYEKLGEGNGIKRPAVRDQKGTDGGPRKGRKRGWRQVHICFQTRT